MADDEVVPMQMSLDEALAPERPMNPVPRAFAGPGGANWRFVNTNVSGKGWHVVVRSRGSSGIVTACGLGGRRVSAVAKAFDACPDCLQAVLRS